MLESFFRPQAVAVIGASANPEKIGGAVLKNLTAGGYPGKVYPVNPHRREIAGLPCFPNVDALPERVDLAVCVVPAPAVGEVAKQCGEREIKSLVVVSAGFKEVGKEGLAREKELVQVCRRYGIRLLGPNCVGIFDSSTPLNASFAVSSPLRGKIAFISQSGAMLLAILDWSLSSSFGFSKMVSLGNKADLNEANFIAEIAEDPETAVILCYLEDVARGEGFLEVAREAARKKPVIIFKAGTSGAGIRAASSHTGALAGNDLAYTVAFRQTGIIRAYSVPELFDLALAFAHQPLPRGKRVAIVTNAGGPGIIATDEVERQGLEIAAFTRETVAALRANLPREASVYNPVDILGDAPAARYAHTLAQVLADPHVENVLVLLCPTAVTSPKEVAEIIVNLKSSLPDKPLLAAYLGGKTLAEGAALLNARGIPCFTFPEPAVRALKGLVSYAQVKKAPGQEGLPSLREARPEIVKAVFYDVLRDRRTVLLGSEGAQVGEAYGLSVCPVYLAREPGEAGARAEEIGYPVVLKIASPRILHKTDVGGVRLPLENRERVEAGFVEILENVRRHLPDAPVYGVEVQKMLPPGMELIVGMTRDLQFGPLIAFGLGGIYVNLLQDVAFRLARFLSLSEIEEMIQETKAYGVLKGYRGGKPADLAALTDFIARVARLVLDFPEITELDINPLFAYPQGVVALDIKLTIEGI